jgi:glycosyltransferase involved in cell wall biosynthesis
MVSWEFPPRIVGGIASHVYNLSRDLVREGIDTYVVTCDFPGAPEYEEIDGVHVFRVDSYTSPSPDFASWVYLMNVNMEKKAVALIRRLDNQINLIHAHDWLVANSAIGLKHIFRVPLLATIHSTEIGRRNSLHTNYERMIHQTEARLTQEAWKVICCSQYMTSHVEWAFGLPKDKVMMIPNGVDTNAFHRKIDGDKFRSKYASADEKIVLFVGRFVHEKGVHVLIGAMPKVLSRADAKFVIVGNGYMKDSLIGQVHRMGLADKAYFTGFVDDQTLKLLYDCADICVVPSLYEPFGIVALEAMAAQTPVVASDTGGLSEIIDHDKTGVKVYPDNSDSLAWGITRLLLDPDYANWIKKNAYNKVLKEYTWRKIGERTKILYQRVYDEYKSGTWKPT